MPIVPFPKPASIATTDIPTAPGGTSSSTTSWVESSSHFRSEADTVAIAIHNVRLLDGSGHAIERATVIVQEKRTHPVGPCRVMSIPGGAARSDGRGFHLSAGLTDFHVQLSPGPEPDVVKTIDPEAPAETGHKDAHMARRTLEGRVTTVRDVGARDHS